LISKILLISKIYLILLISKILIRFF
jgi:hypothetical protein